MIADASTITGATELFPQISPFPLNSKETERRRQMVIPGAAWGTPVVSGSRRGCVADPAGFHDFWLSSDCTHIEQVKHFWFVCQQTPVDLIIPKLVPLWPTFIISPLPEAVWAETFWVFLMTITCVSILACQRIPQKHLIYPWTAPTSAMQGGSSNTTQRPGHERREVFPICDEKAKEKKFIKFAFHHWDLQHSPPSPGSAFGTLPCRHRGGSSAAQRTQKLSCSECAENWFFFFSQTFRLEPESQGS